VAGGAGQDFLNLFGYVVSAETPVTVAQLEVDGIVPTGFASASGQFNFPNTDITSTFQPGVPEPSTWAMMLVGFAGLGFAGYRASRKSVASVAG
jgi:PEP-CTERM motif